MKHQPILISGDDLCDRIMRDADNQRPADYGVRPGPHVMWLVQWPEHVHCPRFNGDATYSRAGRARTARGRARIAARWGARIYGE